VVVDWYIGAPLEPIGADVPMAPDHVVGGPARTFVPIRDVLIFADLRAIAKRNPEGGPGRCPERRPDDRSAGCSDHL
jgi:hypothetical protein